MSNHDIGYAMQDMLEEILYLKDHNEIDLSTAKKLVDVAIDIVEGEDGNRNEATLVFTRTHCGKCLRKLKSTDLMFDSFSGETAFRKAKIYSFDPWIESYSLYLCKDCYNKLINKFTDEQRKNLVKEISKFEKKFGPLWIKARDIPLF